MVYFTLSINLIENEKLFIYQNNWNCISIAKIHMQELKKITCKFMRYRVKNSQLEETKQISSKNKKT